MVKDGNDPSARMHVLSRGLLQFPAQCMVCGNGSHDDGYLDIGVFFDYEGQCYLCMTCAYQAGETVGLFTPAEVKHTQDIAEKLAEENEALKKELDDAKQHLASANNLLRSRFLVNSDFAGPASEDPKPINRNSDDNLSDASSRHVSRKPEVKESTPSLGRSDSGGIESTDLTP